MSSMETPEIQNAEGKKRKKKLLSVLFQQLFRSKKKKEVAPEFNGESNSSPVIMMRPAGPANRKLPQNVMTGLLVTPNYTDLSPDSISTKSNEERKIAKSPILVPNDNVNKVSPLPAEPFQTPIAEPKEPSAVEGEVAFNAASISVTPPDQLTLIKSLSVKSTSQIPDERILVTASSMKTSNEEIKATQSPAPNKVPPVKTVNEEKKEVLTKQTSNDDLTVDKFAELIDKVIVARKPTVIEEAVKVTQPYISPKTSNLKIDSAESQVVQTSTVVSKPLAKELELTQKTDKQLPSELQEVKNTESSKSKSSEQSVSVESLPHKVDKDNSEKSSEETAKLIFKIESDNSDASLCEEEKIQGTSTVNTPASTDTGKITFKTEEGTKVDDFQSKLSKVDNTVLGADTKITKQQKTEEINKVDSQGAVSKDEIVLKSQDPLKNENELNVFKSFEVSNVQTVIKIEAGPKIPPSMKIEEVKISEVEQNLQPNIAHTNCPPVVKCETISSDASNSKEKLVQETSSLTTAMTNNLTAVGDKKSEVDPLKTSEQAT